jgi:hypothetical protein
MFKDIDLFSPDFVIDCSKYNVSKALYKIMKSKKIRSYAYGMCYHKTPLTFDFIKIGLSCPALERKNPKQFGERLVRQAASLKGWNEPYRRSTNGDDLWKNIKRECFPKGILTRSFNKNNLHIAVWDISKRMPNSNVLPENELTAVAWTEGELSGQYKNKFGKLPPINFKDPTKTHAYRDGHIMRSTMDLFEKVS